MEKLYTDLAEGLRDAGKINCEKLDLYLTIKIKNGFVNQTGKKFAAASGRSNFNQHHHHGRSRMDWEGIGVVTKNVPITPLQVNYRFIDSTHLPVYS